MLAAHYLRDDCWSARMPCACIFAFPGSELVTLYKPIKKALYFHTGLYYLWLLNLGSNQGPTD
jgi:hypothetical protein